MTASAHRKSRVFAVLIIVILGVAAGAMSYYHMRHLAELHGETGWRAHVFPITVDGVEITASVILFLDRLAGRKPRPLAWAAMIIGTVISLFANVLVADADVINRAVAGWPPLALLLAIKLLLGLLEDHQPGAEDSESGDDQVATEPQTGRKATNGAIVVPTTKAAQVRWMRLWEDIQVNGGTDKASRRPQPGLRAPDPACTVSRHQRSLGLVAQCNIGLWLAMPTTRLERSLRASHRPHPEGMYAVR